MKRSGNYADFVKGNTPSRFGGSLNAEQAINLEGKV